MNEPRKYLSALGFSESEIDVYLAMLAGALAARDIIKVTQMKRPTVYYALGCLEKRGVISKTGLEGDGRFTIEHPEKLAHLASEKVLESQQLQNNVSELVPFLVSQMNPSNTKPTVAFFEGKEAVKHAIMDMLYCKDKKFDSIVSRENFFWQIGKEFVERFVKERTKRGISTKTIWDTTVEGRVLHEYYKPPSEVRLVPIAMKGTFNTTVFLFDDKTLYISSLKNSYCVLITSQEHHDTMQAWFDAIWDASRPHKIKKEINQYNILSIIPPCSLRYLRICCLANVVLVISSHFRFGLFLSAHIISIISP